VLRAKQLCVHTIGIVLNRDIIDQIISIQVKVVDPGILVIEVPFEASRVSRFLEQFHYSIQIQVVSRQTKIFIRIILRDS